MDWEFELVAGPYGGTTEGPAWDGQALLFTNIPNSRIMRYDPNTGECPEYFTGTNGTNGLNFDLEGCDSYKDGKLRQGDCRLEGFLSYIHPLSLPLSGFLRNFL